jgi:hypothetical protein
MTELNDILTQLADEVIEQAQRNIGAIRSVRTWNGRTVKRRIDTTGTLRNNLGYSITQTAGNPTIKFSAGGAAKSYFAVVNEGRKAGTMPPPSAIVAWMKKKPVRLRSASGAFIKTTDKGLARAAFAIAKSIKKRGTPATRYYDDAIQIVLNSKSQEFTNKLTELINKELEKWQ